jgi:arylsulfatase A-like enzyme
VRATFHRIDVVPATPPAERSFSVIALVPRGAELRARHAGPGRAEIRVEVAGSAPLAARPGGEGDLRADLGPLAGKAARFSFTAEGEGAWKEAVLTAPAPEALPAPPRARNIVLWVVDTLRADKLGCYNPKTRVRTPNFDGFARQGVLFRKAIAQSSHSKPATATILTGHYPASHGGNAHRDRLRAGVPLISELFQRAGYETAVFAGNGFIGKPHGFGRGWNTFRNLLREGKPAKAPYLFPHVRRWLQRKREKPFFLYVHTVDPHVPYNPPKHFLALYWQGRYLGPLIPRRSGHQLDDARAGKFRVGPIDRKYAEALYDGEVSVADYWFGKFLDALEEAGLAKETLLAVTADHGEEFWERGNPGHGHTLYNELVRVPFLLGPAPLTPAGRVVEADVEMVDLAPTLLEMAGVSVPSEMQGRSLVPLVRAEPPVPAPAFSIHEDRIAAAQAGPWKYIIYRGGQEHLFDLGADPAEKHDVLAREPLVRRWLRGLLARWLHLQGTWRKSRQGILGQPR